MSIWWEKYDKPLEFWVITIFLDKLICHLCVPQTVSNINIHVAYLDLVSHTVQMGKLMCMIEARILLCWSDFRASRVCLDSVTSARKVQGDICGCFAKVKGRVLAVESSGRREYCTQSEHVRNFHRFLGGMVIADMFPYKLLTRSCSWLILRESTSLCRTKWWKTV